MSSLFLPIIASLLIPLANSSHLFAYTWASGVHSKHELKRLRQFSEILPDETSSLGILWWNVERGASAAPVTVGSPLTDLEHNLLSLA